MNFDAVPEFEAYASDNDTDTVIAWCGKNFPNGSWWYLGFNHFGFDCEKNHVLFTLRWT